MTNAGFIPVLIYIGWLVGWFMGLFVSGTDKETKMQKMLITFKLIKWPMICLSWFIAGHMSLLLIRLIAQDLMALVKVIF